MGGAVSLPCCLTWGQTESEKKISPVQFFVTPWTIAHQAPLSMEFSRQEFWSGLLLPSPGDLPNPGIKPRSLTLQEDSLPTEPPGKPNYGGGNEDMETSFKRSHACTVVLGAPHPAADHHQPKPPSETPGHSRASLGQSFVGSLLLSPGFWCAQGSICILQESVSQSCVSSGTTIVGKWQAPPRGLMPYPGLLYPEPLSLQQSTADLYLCRRHSHTVLVQSLWDLWVLVCTRFVWTLWPSLVGMGLILNAILFRIISWFPYASKFGKLSSGHRTGKGQFSF